MPRLALALRLGGLLALIGASLFFKEYQILIVERSDAGSGTTSECQNTRPGKVISGDETHGRVDLVVQWYCEDISWLRHLSSDLRPFVAIFIADQGHGKCDSTTIASNLAHGLEFPVTHVQFPNLGRDGHATVSFIQRYYDELAEFSFFVQGGFHWYARGLQGATGWGDQAEVCNSLIPEVLEANRPFTPLVMRTKQGPVLAVDAEMEDGTNGKINTSTNIFKFGVTGVDMRNRGKELYSILFGTSPCDSGPYAWAPGMQYIIRRDRLRARPCEHWAAIRVWLERCFEYIWVLERVTTPLFNSSLELVPPKQWRTPTFCTGSREASSPTPSFWRRSWGCEPLSPQALDWHTQQAKLRTATIHVLMQGGLGNQLFGLAALLAIAELANATPAFLGRIRIAVPDRKRTLDDRQTYWKSVTSYFKKYLSKHQLLEQQSFVECTVEEKPLIPEPFGREFLIGKRSQGSLRGDDWAMEIVRGWEDTQQPIPAIQKAHGCDLFKLKGYFQDRRFFNAVYGRLPELFSHRPSLRLAHEELEKLVPVAAWNSSVSIHYRMKDTAGGWEVADDFYPAAVRLVEQRLKKPLTCVIFSDDTTVAWNRSQLLHECATRVLVSPSTDTVTSFYMMSLLPNGIVAASSFSYWASVVGRKSLVVAPDMTYKMFHYLKQQPQWLMVKSQIKGCHTHCNRRDIDEQGWPPVSSSTKRKPVPAGGDCEAVGRSTRAERASCSTCSFYFDGTASALDTERWCGWSHTDGKCRSVASASLDGKAVLMSCGTSHLKPPLLYP